MPFLAITSRFEQAQQEKIGLQMSATLYALNYSLMKLISFSFLTHGPSVGRLGSHCYHAVVMENQHALRKDTAAKRNACALDFGRDLLG